MPAEHNECVELFNETTRALGDGLTLTLWGTDPLAQKLAAAWCGDQTWQLKLVRVRKRTAKLLTPQPQLHAADAPMRSARLRIQGCFYALDAENWSLQRGTFRRRPLPQHLLGDNVAIFLFGGEGSAQRAGDEAPEEELQQDADVDGPARAQQRDASQERARRWALVLRELKRAIERVHLNLGHPKLPAMLRALSCCLSCSSFVPLRRLSQSPTPSVAEAESIAQS